MRPADGGSGYGGRVAIDPTELRTVSTTYFDAAGDLRSLASQVGCCPVPELPPEIVGRVTSELHAVDAALARAADPFADGATELRVRALWAEISAAGGVTGLSAGQIREFVALMKDGAMLDYATVEQRRMAGTMVGELYRGTYKEPAKLIELAGIMGENGRDAQFAGAFIEEFGAERYADIPRVIQAMQWATALATGNADASDPRVDRELARDLWLQDYRFEGDAEELLANFSMALATATSTRGALSRETQRELAHDPDRWAVAQLMHTGRFGKEFLTDAFHSGVIAQLRDEGGKLGWGNPVAHRYPIGDLPIDPKQIILDALQRNQEAVALAFSTDVPEEFRGGVLQGEKDPLTILYDHMDWDGEGEEQFGRMYEAATRWYNDDDHADPERAGRMTLALIDRTMNGERDLDPLTTALANDLAQHHMESLHLSAAAADLADADRGTPGWLDPEDGYRLNLNVQHMTDLFRDIGEVSDARDSLLAGAAAHQAEVIERAAAGDGSDFAWARQVGGFNGVVMAAHDLDHQADFDAAQERHRIVFSFLNQATSLIDKPGIGIPIGLGLEELKHMSEPDVRERIEADGSSEAALRNQLRASMVHGYDQAGLIENVPERFVDDDGHLRPYSELDKYDRAAFNRWASSDGGVDQLLREAFQNADDTQTAVIELVVR